MAYCVNCGNKLAEGAKFCEVCGTVVGGGPMQAAPKVDYVSTMDELDVKNHRFFAAVEYLGPLFVIIALIAYPKSKYLRYHANQSLLLTLGAFAVWLVSALPLWGGRSISGVNFLSVLGYLSAGIPGVVLVVFAIIGIVHAAKGEAVDLPLLGHLRLIRHDDAEA